MKRILICCKESCFNYENPTGPGKSIIQLIAILKDDFEIYVLSTYSKKIKFYRISKTTNIEEVRILNLIFLKFNLVYINGIYSILFVLIPTLIYNSKIVISPRGMLGEESFKYKRYRKVIFIYFLKLIFKTKNIVFFASSSKEFNEIKQVFNSRKFYIFKCFNLTGITSKQVKKKYKFFNKKSLFKFITPSTISRKKNLLNTIKALNMIKNQVNFTYHIIGSVQDKNYETEIKNYILKNNLSKKIKILKPLSNKILVEKLKDYTAMLFFTHGENFGHIIPESVKAQLPFLISNKTTWNNFDEFFFGMICDESINRNLSNFILNFCNLNKSEQYQLKLALKFFFKYLERNEIESRRRIKIFFKEI